MELRRQGTRSDPGGLAQLDPAGRWAKRRGLGLVEAARHVGDAVAGERRYYLRRAPLRAAALGRAVRGHWGSAHRVPWALAVSCPEAACRVRADHGPRNLAVLRHVARNVLRLERTRRGSSATNRVAAALDETYLARVLAGVAALQLLVPNYDAFALGADLRPLTFDLQTD